MKVELVEYHGWIVLKCDDASWSDDEWEAAREGAREALAELHERDGHSAHLDWPANGGSVVALNGWTQQPDDVLGAVERIGELAPDSYGELAFFQTAKPDELQMRVKVRAGRAIRLAT